MQYNQVWSTPAVTERVLLLEAEGEVHGPQRTRDVQLQVGTRLVAAVESKPSMRFDTRELKLDSSKRYFLVLEWNDWIEGSSWEITGVIFKGQVIGYPRNYIFIVPLLVLAAGAFLFKRLKDGNLISSG